jgi:hypothetical protein
MSTSLARTELDTQGRSRSAGADPVFARIAELEKRVLAMDDDATSRGTRAVRAIDAVEKPSSRSGAPGSGKVSVIRTVSEFEALLPQLIEDAVNTRFQKMTATLQREVEETNIRAIETFVQNVQAKLTQRISLLEANMNKQAETMSELRECSQRTENNLIRLISGVEKLARELPKALPAPLQAVRA